MTPQEFAAQFDVSRETLARLLAYQALLGKWQQSINLVGPATLPQFWSRHAADSAQLLRLAAPDQRIWLDLGSGGGFPGLIIAILLVGRGGYVHLFESDHRKAGFLRTVIRETGAPATVYAMRIESAAAHAAVSAVGIQVISARALAPLPKLLGYVVPFFNSSTIALLHKGRGWQEELTQAQQYWKLQVQDFESVTDPSARILKFTAVSGRSFV